MDKIDIKVSSPNCRNYRNQKQKKTNSTGEKKGYGKKHEKPRWSKKFKCPQCNLFPLEIYIFNVSPRWKDFDSKDDKNIYVCHHCETFFRKNECDIK